MNGNGPLKSVAAAPDEGIREAGAGSEHLDADLSGVGNWRLFRQFKYLGAAEPNDTNVLPRHAANIAMGSTLVARTWPGRVRNGIAIEVLQLRPRTRSPCVAFQRTLSKL